MYGFCLFLIVAPQMIDIQQHGSVTAIRMARTFLGRPLYWTTAYWLDGLLIDSGPPCLAGELVRVVEQLGVEQIVVTHGHEDHTGGLHALRRRFPGQNPRRRGDNSPHP